MRDLTAELMKIRTRWLPYIVLIAILLGVAAQVLLLGVVGYHDEQDDYGPSPPGLRAFAMPWALHSMLDAGQFWGVIFIAFVIASLVGTEFGWGTVRAALARGQSRVRYLTTKLVGATLISTILLLVALGVGVIMSLVASHFEGQPITLDVRGGPSPLEVVVMILRTALAILPYGMLTFALSVLGRSTAFGATGLLLYKVAEMILLPLFNELGGFWDRFEVLFIGHYADSLIAANRIDAREYNSFAFRDNPLAANLPDPWAAAFMLLVFTAVFAAIAFASFTRRDLNARSD